MADNNSTGKQAEAILHAQDYLKILKTRWKEAFFVFLLIFFCAALITKLMERRYTSVARIEIKTPRETVDVTGSGGRSSLQAEATKEYIVTQFEILVSDNNLKQVAKNLNMPEAEKEDGSAASVLRPKIKIEPVAGTNMVDIVVTDTDPNQACSVCEQVVQVYRQARNDEEESLRNQAVIDLEKAHKDALNKLEDAENALALIISNDKFRDQGYISASNPWAENSAADEAAGGLRQRYSELKSEVVALEKALSKIEWYKDYLLGKGRKETAEGSNADAQPTEESHLYDDEKLLTYIANTKLEHTESKATEEIAALYKARNDLKLALKQALTEGYGKKHLKVLELQNQIDANQTALEERLTAWKASLDPDIDLKNRELAIAKSKMAEIEKQLREYDEITKQIAKAREDYKNAKAEELESKKLYNDEKRRQKVTRASIVEHNKPYVAKAPSTPNVQLNLIVGAVVGLISGAVVAFVYNFFDTSVKSLEDAERHLGLPVLGVIPQDVSLLALSEDNNNPDAEAYRILRTNIQLKRDLYKAKTFTVVSANAGEGKSTTLSNLAYVYAKAGYSTLMIDADMRRPRLARYAELNFDTGLSDYLAGNLELKDVVYKTNVPNLYILPSGPQTTDPAGLLGSSRMNQLIAETSKRFDIVFFDSPPVLGVSDASVPVSKVDVTLLVLQPRKMPLKALLRAKSIVENVGGQIMGLVMNNVDISADTQYQYYTTYYSYYTKDNSRVEPVSTEKVVDMAVAKASTKSRTDKEKAVAVENSDDRDLY